MTKLVIYTTFSIKELREKYRIHFGISKGKKILKKDIASWFGNLAEEDVRGIGETDEMEDFA